jgi:hypothetical protein
MASAFANTFDRIRSATIVAASLTSKRIGDFRHLKRNDVEHCPL